MSATQPVFIFTQHDVELPKSLKCISNAQVKNQTRALKKILRTQRNSILIVYLSEHSTNTTALEQLLEYVRSGLQDIHYPILVAVDQLHSHPTVDFLNTDVGYTDVIDLSHINQALLQRKVLSWLRAQQNGHSLLDEHENQTAFLTCINQFSSLRNSLQSTLDSFAKRLNQFCHGAVCLKVIRSQDGHRVLTYSSNQDFKVKCEQSLQELSGFALEYSTPQIELDHNFIQALSQILDQDLACMLVFPIQVYGKTQVSFLCLITRQQMEHVSVKKVELIKEVNRQIVIMFERRVAESNLKNQYIRLKSTLTELQIAKEQLVHKEKMASVGQLAAGIAHEINNPLSFVLSNFEPLDEYVDSIVHMLSLHDQLFKSLSAKADVATESELLDKIHQEKQTQDIGFVLEDVRSLVSESRTGLIRVKDIINDLRSFAHQDQVKHQQFNIKNMLDESFKLLNVKANNEVECVIIVDDELELNSHRGYLQQVVMNLVNNAMQALVETPPTLPKIAVCAKEILNDHRSGDTNLILTVEDNGPGIAPDQLKKVFDPFFTTKSVGEGTGMGLSISYNLIEKLGGRLSVSSQRGKQTIFTIVLPKTNDAAQSKD